MDVVFPQAVFPGKVHTRSAFDRRVGWTDALGERRGANIRIGGVGACNRVVDLGSRAVGVHNALFAS